MPTASPVSFGTVSTPVAFQAEAAALGPIVWATEIDPGTSAPRSTPTIIPASARAIYAAVPVRRIAAGTTVRAEWSYNRTRLESFDRELVTGASMADEWIEFHLERTGSETWPEGVYEVQIFVSDQPAVTDNVEVRDPGV